MTEPQVLEEISYTEIRNDEGKRLGWAPSKADRRRFDQGSRYKGTGATAIIPVEPLEAPARDLPTILAELEGWAIGDERLYGQLEQLHKERPLIADRIAAAAVKGAAAATLHDPTAFLASRLRPKK